MAALGLTGTAARPRVDVWTGALCRTLEATKREYQQLRRRHEPVTIPLDAGELERCHARYGHEGNRAELRRVLSAFALTYRQIGRHEDLATLASLLLAATNQEATAYALLVGAVERFDLQPFCEAGGRRILEEQVYDVVASFSILCPKTVAALKAQQGCERQLELMVTRWFSSLFCCGFDWSKQSFESFCLFLDVVLTKSHDDPHAWLRHVALSILLLNSARMNLAAKAGHLREELDLLARHVPVRDSLLDLLKHPLEPRQMAAFTRLSFVPFGMLCGWSTGMMLSYDLGLTSLPLGALSSMGCFLGGAVVFNFGADAGYSSLAALFKSLVAAPADADLENASPDTGQPTAVLWREDDAAPAECAQEEGTEASEDASDALLGDFFLTAASDLRAARCAR